MAWLEDYAKLAKHLWQKSLKNRGITRIGQTEEGFIHLVKKRPNQSQDQTEAPECEHQYGGEPKNLIAVTRATGTDAVTEAASWTPVTDNHILCAVCAKLMSAGILSALQNHNIEQGRLHRHPDNHGTPRDHQLRRWAAVNLRLQLN